MTKKEKNIAAMYNAVNSVLTANSDKVAQIAAMQDSAARFKSALEELELQNTGFESKASGKTESKNNAEDEMIDGLTPVISVLQVYAKINKNAELASSTGITESRMKEIRDIELLNKANYIYSKAEEIGEGLANYGITPEKITALRTLIDNYDAAMGGKDTGFAEKSAARKGLTDAFNKADDILKGELDNLIELYRNGDIDFYNSYQSARAIKDLGIRHEQGEDPQPAEN
jgi:hypothetical protein